MGRFLIKTMKKVLAVAMRGRYIENPNVRIAGLPTEQRLEVGVEDGTIMTALTTIQKDSMILERIVLNEKDENYRFD